MVIRISLVSEGPTICSIGIGTNMVRYNYHVAILPWKSVKSVKKTTFFNCCRIAVLFQTMWQKRSFVMVFLTIWHLLKRSITISLSWESPLPISIELSSIETTPRDKKKIPHPGVHPVNIPPKPPRDFWDFQKKKIFHPPGFWMFNSPHPYPAKGVVTTIH